MAVNRGTAAEPSGNPHVIEAVTSLAHSSMRVTARLSSGYGVASVVERLPFVITCYVEAGADGADALVWPTRDALRTEDRCGRLAALFASKWARR